MSEQPLNQLRSNHDGQQQHRSHVSIASSKGETILISSAGDVVRSRCRNSPYPLQSNLGKAVPYKWTEDVAMLCCDAAGDGLQNGICSPWSMSQHEGNHRGGLRGGSPAEVASPLHHHQHHELTGGGAPMMHETTSPTLTSISKRTSPSLNRAQKAFRSPPLVTAGFDEDSIVPIQSFDYSQLYEGGNDMAPTLSDVRDDDWSRRNNKAGKENTPQFMHGVPTFCSYFSNVKIRAVSAHPLGAHVLLISHAGLLYSYGLNNYGQLGIGIKSDVRGVHQGYIMTPTIVTPLVENGGKTVACAAGVNHSLVVVETEQQRLVKSRSFEYARQQQQQCPSSSSSRPQCLTSRSQTDIETKPPGSESTVYHQMYGFGRNDFMKIGLVSPKLANQRSNSSGSSIRTSLDEMECVILPRRVALRCSVQRNHDCAHGIIAIEASSEHSAALVRKATGDVELYTWGNAMFGALGLPPVQGAAAQQQSYSPAMTVHIVPVPSFVASLSRRSNVDARSSSLLLDDVGEYPVKISLSRCCSFVSTSIGRCFSFGMSEEGMLGLGPGVTEVHQPTEIVMPDGAKDETIVSVSAGASHVVICTKSGNAFAWGAMCHAGLEVKQPLKSPHELRKTPSGKPSTFLKTDAPTIEWSPKRVEIPVERSDSNNNAAQSSSISQAFAGYDCSFFVAESGKVFSTGKNSGRLGRGELIADVVPPTSLFGGLHLFKQPPPDSLLQSSVAKSSGGTKRLLRRGTSS